MTFIEFSRQRGLAPDGRCKSFAEAADGAGWRRAPGCSSSSGSPTPERNGHRVLALLRGSAVNQDGASQRPHRPQRPLPGAGDPPGAGRRRARARPTSTRSRRTAPAPRSATRSRPAPCSPPTARNGSAPLRLGSIKSNIGHTQAAAGVAGVIKMTEADAQGRAAEDPARRRPLLEGRLGAGAIELLTEPRPWEPSGRPRRAGVSSFGISGTNAHVILEQAPGRSEARTEAPEREPLLRPLTGPVPFALSAKSRRRLRDAARAARRPAARRARPRPARRRLLARHDPPPCPSKRRRIGERPRRAARRPVRARQGRAPASPRARPAPTTAGSPSSSPARAPSASAWAGALRGRPGVRRVIRPGPRGPRPPPRDPAASVLFAKGKKAKARLDDTDLRPARPVRARGRIGRGAGEARPEPDLLAGHSVGEIAAAHIAGVLDARRRRR